MFELWSKGALEAEEEGLRVEGEESTSSPGADIMNMLMGCEGAGSGQ